MRRPHTASEARAQLIKENKAYKYIDECRGSMLREIFANAYKELDKDYRRNCDPSSMYEILDRDVLDGHTLETVIDVIKIQHRISVPFINLCMLIAKIMVDCGDDDADAFLSQAHSDIMYMSRNKLFDLGKLLRLAAVRLKSELWGETSESCDSCFIPKRSGLCTSLGCLG